MKIYAFIRFQYFWDIKKYDKQTENGKKTGRMKQRDKNKIKEFMYA